MINSINEYDNSYNRLNKDKIKSSDSITLSNLSNIILKPNKNDIKNSFKITSNNINNITYKDENILKSKETISIISEDNLCFDHIFNEKYNFSIGTLQNSYAKTFSTYHSSGFNKSKSKMKVSSFFLKEIKKQVTVFCLFSGITDINQINLNSKRGSISLKNIKRKAVLSKNNLSFNSVINYNRINEFNNKDLRKKGISLTNPIPHIKLNININSEKQKENIKSKVYKFQDFSSFADDKFFFYIEKYLKSSQPAKSLFDSITNLIFDYINTISSKEIDSNLLKYIQDEIDIGVVMILDEYLWVASKGNSRIIASFKEGEEIFRLNSILNKYNSYTYYVNNYIQESNRSTVEVNIFRISEDLDFISIINDETTKLILNKEIVSCVYQGLLKEINTLLKSNEKKTFFYSVNSHKDLNHLDSINSMLSVDKINENVIYSSMKNIFKTYFMNLPENNISYGLLFLKNFSENINHKKLNEIKMIVNRINLSPPSIDYNNIYPHILKNANIQFELCNKQIIKLIKGDHSLDEKGIKFKINKLLSLCCCFLKK